MSLPVTTFSEDQAEAFDRVAEVLRSAGVDIEESITTPRTDKGQGTLALIGKAGSGKTMLLARLAEALGEAGVETISGDYESRRRKDRRTLAILAPTNKAASVLRNRGVAATTIHRILYTPLYDPEYEKIAEWLVGNGERPEIEGLTDVALDRAAAFFKQSRSVPGALAAAGLAPAAYLNQGGPRWDKRRVIEAIRSRQRDGKCLTNAATVEDDGALVSAARRYFGNWTEALQAAGVRPDERQPERAEN